MRLSPMLLSFLLLLSCREGPLRYGAVSSATPEATEAGMAVLRRGGNAVDAAIAISFSLGVTEPAMSGIGGGTQVMLLLPGAERPLSLEGSTRSPALTPRSYPRDSLRPYQLTTVPSTVKVMDYLYRHYASGQLTWADLLAPAIDQAREGFKMGPFREKIYQRYADQLMGGEKATADWRPDSLSGVVRQPALARTLTRMAEEGGDTFYSEETARQVEADMLQHDGWIRAGDWRSFPDPAVSPGVHFTYKGYEIYSKAEPCGGRVLQAMLNKLTQLEQADPDHYLANLVEAIHHGHQLRIRAASETTESDQGETTHFSVVDHQGMALAVTASINAYYGARRAHPELGFLYNSYMEDFNYEDPRHKYAVGPGRSAYSSMTPTIVTRNGEIQLVIGSPGSARIISTVAQLIDRYASGRTDAAELVRVPRVHAYRSRLYLEDPGWAEQLPQEMRSRFELAKPPAYTQTGRLNAYFGGVHLIVRTPEGLRAYADPRRDGRALTE